MGNKKPEQGGKDSKSKDLKSHAGAGQSDSIGLWSDATEALQRVRAASGSDPNDTLILQQTVGNMAVRRMLANRGNQNKTATIQRDVLPGSRLPDVGEMTEERMKNRLGIEQRRQAHSREQRLLTDAREFSHDGEFLTEVLKLARADIGNIFDSEEDIARAKKMLFPQSLRITRFIGDKLEEIDEFYGARATLQILSRQVNPPEEEEEKRIAFQVRDLFIATFLNQSEEYTESQLPEIPERENIREDQEGTAAELATAFLGSRENVGIGWEMTADDKQQLSARLKQMPTIIAILERGMPPMGDQPMDW